MRMVTTTLVAALLLVAGPALGQQQQQQHQQPRQGQQQPGATQGAQRSYEATKHFAVINAGLQDAKLNAKMLDEISSDPRTYDRDHGELFMKNIRQSLQDAETHLAHLQPLATTKDEKDQYTQISNHIRSATQMLQPMEGFANDPKKINQSAKKLEGELDKGMDPLKKMASSMDAKVKIG